MAETEVTKKSRLGGHLIVPVLLIVILLLVGVKMHYLYNKINQLDQKISSQSRLLQGMIQNSFASEKAVIDPVGQVVYLPEFRIKLPLNDTTKSLAYSMRAAYPRQAAGSPETPEADLTSTQYIKPPQQTRIDCSDLVRLKLEATPKPYSPHEKPTSIPLADGRTLQVYEAVNQAECLNSWSTSISPAQVAAEFKHADSY